MNIENRRDHRYSIVDLRLICFPARIALGEGNQNDRYDRDHQSNGSNAAAHTVEVKKIEQRTQRFGSRTIEKQSRAELAQKYGDQDNPTGHHTRAHLSLIHISEPT